MTIYRPTVAQEMGGDHSINKAGKTLKSAVSVNSFRHNWKVEGGNDSNLLIVFYVQIMPDDFIMQLHRF